MKHKLYYVCRYLFLIVITVFVIFSKQAQAAEHPQTTNAEKTMLSIFNTHDSATDKLEQIGDLAILRFALKKHGVNPSEWKVVGKSLAATEKVKTENEGKTVQINKTISVANSGFNPDNRVYAALIENAENVDNTENYEDMQLDNYSCDLLVLQKTDNKWKVDFFGQVDENHYTGGSQLAQSCGDGYRLTWVNGRPAFVDRNITTGPYSGGYSTAVMSIGWKEGKYKLDGIILYEGYLDNFKLVADYSIGKKGDKEYEHFSFHSVNDERGKITYSYGGSKKKIKLTYLGKDTCKGEACFKVRFPNNFELKIIPKENYLEVVSQDGLYSKIFRNEHCEDCLGDKESMAMVRVYFLK